MEDRKAAEAPEVMKQAKAKALVGTNRMCEFKKFINVENEMVIMRQNYISKHEV